MKYFLLFILVSPSLYYLSNIYFSDFDKFKFLISNIGAGVGFFIVYRRYERDKEMEIIEKYAKEYDGISDELNRVEIQDKGIAYGKLLNIWYKEFYLYSKGYISNSLWKEWSYWIGFKLEEVFRKSNDEADVFIVSLLKYHDYGIANNHKWSVILNGSYARIKNRFGWMVINEEDFYVFLMRKISKLKSNNDIEFNNLIDKLLNKLGRKEFSKLNKNLHI